ncbi:hypothetical protein P3S67_015911 [Capsicum chacoense]
MPTKISIQLFSREKVGRNVKYAMYEGNEEGLWLHCVKYSGPELYYSGGKFMLGALLPRT